LEMTLDHDLAFERSREPRAKRLAHVGCLLTLHDLPSAAADRSTERDLLRALRAAIEVQLQLEHLSHRQLSVQKRFPRSAEPWAGRHWALLVRRYCSSSTGAGAGGAELAAEPSGA